MGGESVLSWLATYTVHSTLLLGGAWLATRKGPLGGSSARDAIWKIASTGALLTATLQLALPAGGPQLEWAELLPARVWWSELPATAAEDGTWSVIRLRRDPGVAGPRAETSPGGPPAREEEPPVAAVTVAPESVVGPGAGLPGEATLVAGYLVVATLLLVRHLLRRRRFQDRLRERRAIVGGPAREALDDLLRRAGLERRVHLTATGTLTSPVALPGNEICIPERAVEDLDRRSLRALLAHELAHLERHDPLWIEFASALQSLLFLQPLHRLGRRELRSAAEEECDAWAARLTGERYALARCLVEVAGWMRLGRRAEALGMAEPGPSLERRVERLIGRNPDPGGSWRTGALAGIGMVVAVACGGPAVRPAEDAPASGEPGAAVPAGRVSPPSVVAARPADPEIAKPVAPAVTAEVPADTSEASARVREYVWGEGDRDPWFAFDWSPETLREEMERLGETLERSLEPLEDFEFRFDPGLLEGFEFRLDTPGMLLDLPGDTLHIRDRGPGAAPVALHRLRVRIEGEVRWGEGTVAWLSPGGRVEIADLRQKPSRRLVVTPGEDGELGFDYELDGRPHAFDEPGRAWLRGVVEKIRAAGDENGPLVRRGQDVVRKGLDEIRIFRRDIDRLDPGERRKEMRGGDQEALRSRLRALEREIDRLKREIERLETEDLDS